MHKFKVLPDWADHIVKTHTRPGKARKAATLMVFLALIGVFCMFIPAFAGVGSFFGYGDDSVEGVYSEILNGESARKTLKMCLGTDVMKEVNGMKSLDMILKFTSLLGLGFVLIYVTAEILDTVQKGLMTGDKLASILITFALPALIIVNISNVTKGIQTAGTATMEAIVSTLEDVNDIGTVTQEEIDFENRKYQFMKNVVENQKRHEGDNVSEEVLYVEKNVDKWIENNNKSLGKPRLRRHVESVVNGTNLINETDISKIQDEYAEKEAENTQGIEDADDPLEATWEGMKLLGNRFKYGWRIIKGKVKNKTAEMIDAAADFVLELILIFIDMGIRISIMIASFGVLGRLIIYKAFLPISIADIGKEGSRSNGMRVVKLYFAVYIEIAMFYILNLAGWKIFDILVMKQETVAGLIICFVGAGAGIRTLMKSSKTLTERIIGVN